MENKLTALQDLIRELKQFQKFPMVDQPTIEAAIEFAEMRLESEKQQIMEAFDYGDYCVDLPDGSWEQKYKSPEHYYEENYGK